MPGAEIEQLKEKKNENGFTTKRTILKIRCFVYVLLLFNLIEYGILEIPKIRKELLDLGLSLKILPFVLLTLIICKAAQIFCINLVIFIVVIDVAYLIHSDSEAFSLLNNLLRQIIKK